MIGQADAGVLSSGGYTLNGGFWLGSSNGYAMFLPVIVKWLAAGKVLCWLKSYYIVCRLCFKMLTSRGVWVWPPLAIMLET